MKYLIIFVFAFSAISNPVFSQIISDTVFIKKSDNQNIYYEPVRTADQVFNISKSSLTSGYLAIQLHQGKYSLYSPCDWVYHKEITFNNDSVEINFGEKISYAVISKNFNENNDFTSYNLRSDDGLETTLEIKTIDKLNGIGVARFDIAENKNEYQYLLVVEFSKASKYPIIVNDCIGNKNSEMEFDKVDLVKLFNQ